MGPSASTLASWFPSPRCPTVPSSTGFTGKEGDVARGAFERCIVHLDLDCFYAQVEAVRIGADPAAPLAVQQWGSLIAGE